MTHVTTKISANDIRSALNGYPASDRILLFKTRNSSLAYNAPFDHNFIALDSSAARYLVELKCKAIGIGNVNDQNITWTTHANLNRLSRH